MNPVLDDHALDLVFREARTFVANPDPWQDRPLSDDLLRQAWDLAKMAPTSANCMPARIVFVRSPQAKEKLRPALDEGNLAKTLAAPATAIVGMDLAFFEQLQNCFRTPMRKPGSNTRRIRCSRRWHCVTVVCRAPI